MMQSGLATPNTTGGPILGPVKSTSPSSGPILGNQIPGSPGFFGNSGPTLSGPILGPAVPSTPAINSLYSSGEISAQPQLKASGPTLGPSIAVETLFGGATGKSTTSGPSTGPILGPTKVQEAVTEAPAGMQLLLFYSWQIRVLQLECYVVTTAN